MAQYFRICGNSYRLAIKIWLLPKANSLLHFVQSRDELYSDITHKASDDIFKNRRASVIGGEFNSGSKSVQCFSHAWKKEFLTHFTFVFLWWWLMQVVSIYEKVWRCCQKLLNLAWETNLIKITQRSNALSRIPRGKDRKKQDRPFVLSSMAASSLAQCICYAAIWKGSGPEVCIHSFINWYSTKVGYIGLIYILSVTFWQLLTEIVKWQIWREKQTKRDFLKIG